MIRAQEQKLRLDGMKHKAARLATERRETPHALPLINNGKRRWGYEFDMD
jgi:hypothetical protein